MLVNSMDDQSAAAGPVDVQDQVARLTRQVENLQEAVISRQRVGVAVGLLAQRLDCSVDQAWKLLAWMSQTTNVKARVIAQVLVDKHSRQLSPGDAELSATIDSLLPHPSAVPTTAAGWPTAGAGRTTGGAGRTTAGADAHR